MVGTLADSGTITHFNDSYFKWQHWEDIVGEYDTGDTRCSFQYRQKNSFPFFTGVTEIGWVDPDNPEDGRVYIRTKAARAAAYRYPGASTSRVCCRRVSNVITTKLKLKQHL